jgi:hypothetical protein
VKHEAKKQAAESPDSEGGMLNRCVLEVLRDPSYAWAVFDFVHPTVFHREMLLLSVFMQYELLRCDNLATTFRIPCRTFLNSLYFPCFFVGQHT